MRLQEIMGIIKDIDFIKKGQWIIYLFITVIIAFFFVPMHELGHVIAGWLSGIPMSMSYAREYTLNGQAETAFLGLGGPIFTVVLAYIGVFIIYKRKFLMIAYPFSVIMCIDRIFIYLICFFSIDMKTFLEIKGLPGMDEKGVAELLKVNPYTFFAIIQVLELIAIILILFSLRYSLRKNLFIILLPVIAVIPMIYIGFNFVERNIFPEQYKMQFGMESFPIHLLLSSAGVISILLALILCVIHIQKIIKKKAYSKLHEKTSA